MSVYFASCEPNLIKIGYSANPADRVRGLRGAATAARPDYADLATIHGIGFIDGSAAEERRLHEKFSHLRIEKTEWFRAETELLDFIVSLPLKEIATVRARCPNEDVCGIEPRRLSPQHFKDSPECGAIVRSINAMVSCGLRKPENVGRPKKGATR